MCASSSARHQREALLHDPALRHLGNGLCVSARDLGQHGIVQEFAARQRAIGGHDQAVAAAGGQHLVLLEIGVHLDLVGDQRLRAQTRGLVEQRHGEVRHADVARQPLARLLLKFRRQVEHDRYGHFLSLSVCLQTLWIQW